MKKLLNLKNIAIALLIVIVVFQQCGGNKKTTGEIVKVDGKKYELIKHEIDTVEVVKTKVVTKKGEDIYHETIKEVTIPAIVDTQALLQDYFAKNIYKDTLQLPDSLGTVSLIDTITQNKMEIVSVFCEDLLFHKADFQENVNKIISLLEVSFLASQKDSIDPMETAIGSCYEKYSNKNFKTVILWTLTVSALLALSDS